MIILETVMLLLLVVLVLFWPRKPPCSHLEEDVDEKVDNNRSDK